MEDAFRAIYMLMERGDVAALKTLDAVLLPTLSQADFADLDASLPYSDLVDVLLAVVWVLQQEPSSKYAPSLDRLANALMRGCIKRAREVVAPEGYRAIPLNENRRLAAAARFSSRLNILSGCGMDQGDSASFFAQASNLSDADLARLRFIVPHMRRSSADVSDFTRDEARNAAPTSPCELCQSAYSGKEYFYFYFPRNPALIGAVIEACLYNAYQGYEKEYRVLERDYHKPYQEYFDNVVVVYSALSHPGNTDLLAATFMQTIRPYELIQASIVELEPAECRELRNKAREEIMASVDLKRFVQNTGIKCRKCKQETVIRLEKQTRSADEATTIEYTCSSCGHKWRVN